MISESKDIIIKNFVTLMKECDVNVLKTLLVQRQVFSQKELDNIFSTDDARHNKRIFFFNIQKKEERAFGVLLESLRNTNQNYIADLLQPRKNKVFHDAYDNEDAEDDIIPATSVISIPSNSTVTPLNILVKHSDMFYDTQAHNSNIEFFSTRSKKRGRVLIINNYQFPLSYSEKQFRKGATVDNENLQNLFRQMGGWEVELHNNKTAEEMNMIIKTFSQYKDNKEYDICFVIVMSHGREKNNDTVIDGIDGGYVFASSIQNNFTNENSKSFRGKPKVFLFQVCRGEDLDHTVRYVTETDSLERGTPKIPEHTSRYTITTVRSWEDMLVGYSTLQGYKSHRHPDSGSWYIEIICEKFMNFAHNTSVDDLLMLVDQRLRRRMSEYHTVQTSEHSCKGFKKLYLHPGIYYEDNSIKTFFN